MDMDFMNLNQSAHGDREFGHICTRMQMCIRDRGNGYAACVNGGTQGAWGTWPSGMNGAKVTVYVTNCGNSTADIQAVMVGTKGKTSTDVYKRQRYQRKFTLDMDVDVLNMEEESGDKKFMNQIMEVIKEKMCIRDRPSTIQPPGKRKTPG